MNLIKKYLESQFKLIVEQKIVVRRAQLSCNLSNTVHHSVYDRNTDCMTDCMTEYRELKIHWQASPQLGTTFSVIVHY